jgi:hypothetical protein
MTKKITETSTIDTKDAPKLPSQLMTYGEAIKLVAGVLRANPDGGSVVIESLRDIVGATGLPVTYEEITEEE